MYKLVLTCTSSFKNFDLLFVDLRYMFEGDYINVRVTSSALYISMNFIYVKYIQQVHPTKVNVTKRK